MATIDCSNSQVWILDPSGRIWTLVANFKLQKTLANFGF